MPTPKQLKHQRYTAKNIKKLNIHKTEIVPDNFWNEHGKIYSGKVIFHDGVKKRVAIKIFKTPLKENEAKAYQKAINRLNMAGVPLPPLELYYDPNIKQWVQISKLYASTSKPIHKRTRLRTNTFEVGTKRWKSAVEIAAKTIEAGFPPDPDYLTVVLNKKIVKPVDLHYIMMFALKPLKTRLKTYKRIIKTLSFSSNHLSPKNHPEWFGRETLRKIKNENLRITLTKLFDEHNAQKRSNKRKF